ncbi:MAG: TAXI family TRAP transporter solute-binding subunit [Cyanobacteria bacterium J06639_14]
MSQPGATEKHSFLERQQDWLLKLLDDRLFKPLDRLTIVLRLLILIAVTVWFGLTAFNLWQSVSFNVIHRPIYHLIFALGEPSGESYILGTAIKQVVETYHPNIRLDIVSTGGSIENFQRLDAREAQLITAQADVIPGSQARAVAVLYRDLFQLLVRDHSRIEQFTDLKGQRIGVSRESGHFLSFLEIANHFGLAAEDFIFVGVDDEEAADAFRHNQVDAIFRVRALGNRVVQDLVEHHRGQLLPIEQAQAMKIQHPAFGLATIPKGTYRGILPTVPAVDIPTVGVHKMLYASKQANSRVIQEIATILQNHRQEIANAIAEDNIEVRPLVVSINRPNSNVGIPVHPGAIAAYRHDTPSFVTKNFDFLALLLSIVVPIASWIWGLRSRAEQRGKSVSESYVSDVIKLMDKDQFAMNETLEDRQKALYQIFDQIAKKLVDEDISQESFRTFNEAYKTAREKIERDIIAEAQKQQSVQQQKTAQHIQDMIRLSQANDSSYDDKLEHIDAVLQRVLDDLAGDRISQESFRTFIEVYKTTKDLIQRNAMRADGRSALNDAYDVG